MFNPVRFLLKRVTLLPVALLVMVILITAACDKNEPPAEDPGFTGWVVGDSANRWGTILQTGNDGFDWYRQGSLSDLTSVNLRDVSAAGALDVWVVGDTLNGYGLIYHTLDGGYTWNRVGDTLTPGAVGLRAVLAKNSSRVWVAGDSGTLLSTDNGGATWTKVLLQGLSTVKFCAITGHKGQRLWVVGNIPDTTGADSAGVVLASIDGGATWLQQFQAQGFPGKLTDVVAVNDTIAYLTGGNHLYKTIDGGSNWYDFYTSSYGNLLSVCADTLGYVWAGGEQGRVHFSRNGGGTWRSILPDLTKYNYTGVTMADTNRVWFSGFASGSANRGIVVYTRNLGDTWFPTKPAENVPLNRISFVNGIK